MFNKFSLEKKGRRFGPSQNLKISDILTGIDEFVRKEKELYKPIHKSFYDGDGLMIVAFMTPLMTRVHELVAQSAEFSFLDSTGTVDR